MTYLHELDSLARQYGNARGVTAATVVEHADECSSLFATIANKAGVQDATQLSLKSFGAFLSHLPGVQVVRGGNKKIGHYSVEVPDPALRSRGSVDNAGDVGEVGTNRQHAATAADVLLDAVAPGVYKRVDAQGRIVNPNVDSDRSVASANGSDRSHRDFDNGIGESIPKQDVAKSGNVAQRAQQGQAGQQFTAREPVAETNAECKYSCAGYTRNIDGGDTSSKAPCHVENDKGTKRPLDPGSKSTNSDNPRVNPALHVPQAPKGYHLRGVSTLLDGDGKPVQQWVKTTQDRDALNIELLFEAIRTLPDSFSAAHTTVKPPSHVTDDLLVLYPVLDVHLGMLSWCEETGNSYDTHIAERLHVQAIKHLVDSAPRAKHAVVASLGDLLHVNDNDARTERSANPLDTDSRFAKVLRVGVGIQRAMIDAALEKHEHVTAYFCVGNHDAQASLMLALGMELFYRNDPRVTICTSPAKFLYHRWGKCLFGFTHGDMVKSENLPGIMATDRARDWGETTCRKFLVGHIHKERVLDMNGCKVEHYRTLAGLEAYAYNAGYRTDRGMSSEYYHREHGFIGNAYVPLSLLEAA